MRIGCEPVSWDHALGVSLPEPKDLTVLRSILKQIERRSGHPAVQCGDVVLRYSDLGHAVTELACALNRFDIRPEERIGLCMNRRSELVVAMLAIWRVGGAYVPLDPAYPPTRLKEIADDAGLRVMVGETATQERFPRAAEVWVDVDKRETGDEALPPVCDDPTRAAYVIYTSGSSGKPKGVVIEHRQLLYLIEAYRHDFELTQEDRVLQFASVNFDASVEDIFPCLATGATLVVRTNEMLSSLDNFWRCMRDWRITLAELPTALWHEWLNQVTDICAAVPRELRMLLIGGERTTPEKVAKWRSMAGTRPRLLNTYGPTETTVTATGYDLTPGVNTEPAGSEVPIGLPLPFFRCYVLDDDRQPVPDGERGELFIGGPCVGRGYLHRKELTEQRFLADPFASDSGARMYASGDCVRRLPSGDIEYLGRIDDQVKIRGHRIELGEVESHIRRLPHVDDVVVVARPDTNGQNRLLAYVAARSPEREEGGAYRAMLLDTLPGVMVPSVITVMERLPITAGGKVDKRGLPEPDPAGEDRSDTEAAASDGLVGELSRLFAAVLGVPAYNQDADFFEHGGDSIKALALCSTAAEAIGRPVNVPLLFEHPSPVALASALEANDASDPRLIPMPIHRKAWLLREEEQEWVFFPWLSQLQGYIQRAAEVHVVLEFTGRLDVDRVESALNGLVARHEAFRWRMQPMRGPLTWRCLKPFLRGLTRSRPVSRWYAWQEERWVKKHPRKPRKGEWPIADAMSLSLSRATLNSYARDTVEPAIVTFLGEPFDLGAGELLRARLYAGENAHWILAVAIHHAAFDGESGPVFADELVRLYRGETLPEPTVSWTDYLYWQYAVKDFQHDLAFWRAYYERVPAPLSLELPFWRSRAPSWDHQQQVRIIDEPLSPEFMTALTALAAAQRATPYMVCLAALAVSLRRYVDRERLPINTMLSGRSRPETAALVACVTKAVTLVIDSAAGSTFSELIESVRDSIREVIAHQEVPQSFLAALEMRHDQKNGQVHRPAGDYPGVFFDIRRYAPPVVVDEGLQLKEWHVPDLGSDPDIMVLVINHPDGHRLTMHYSPDRYENAGVDAFFHHYRTVLETVVLEPWTAIQEYIATTSSAISGSA